MRARDRCCENAYQPAPLSSSAPRLSIVVLPFANIGGDPDQEYFVDGVTESLTTDLSRISDAFVIARNTAFTFNSKAVDVKKLGRELNVHYVLEGLDSRLIQASLFAAFVMPPARGMTIPPLLRDATARLRACDWPVCLRGEVRQLTERAPGSRLVA